MGVRKCSKCGKTGHNSRTCRNASSNCGKIMKLFGVELAKIPFPADDGSKLKNFSKTEIMPLSSDEDSDKLKLIINGVNQGQRKKGIPWTEEEHKLFLLGLEKLGKGNWRGISRNFVTSRTSTQVASHAQKYFLRRINANKNKSSPTIISMMRRNEAPYRVYSMKKPNNPPPKLPEGPYICRLFNTSAPHENPPSLELSLAAPAAAVWERRPVLLCKKQYMAKNI